MSENRKLIFCYTNFQFSTTKLFVYMLPPNSKQEKKLWQMYRLPLIALDEAGRGSLAGPVTAAALVIRKPSEITLAKLKKLGRLADSKHLSAQRREKIYFWLRTSPQFCFTSSSVSAKTIDKVNIRQANFRAMRQAIAKLSRKTGLKRFIVLVDGKEKITGLKTKQFSFIKGDERLISLALASIVAKVRRDRIMISLARRFPRYAFAIHKGYGTKLHYQRLKKYACSAVHRQSFLKNFK